MSSFRNAIAGFLAELEGLHFSLPVIMHKIEETHKEAVGKLESYLEAHNNSKLEEEVTDKRGTRTVTRYEIDVEHHFALGTLQSGSVRLTAASVIIPRSFVIALVSQFDAFLGRLLRAVYANRPEILNASERNLTFANLIEFNSIDEAREYVLEKEIEAVLRESHTEHFDYLERKLGIELRKGLDIWPTFIEVTERRNLFVHTDGVVSTQYIAVCKKHKVNLILGEKVGQVLEADPGYLNTTYNCLYEIAVKLSQVLWRKLLPGELEEADIYLTMVCYELLKREEYTLTGRLLDFALTLPRHSSQRFKLVWVFGNCREKHTFSSLALPHQEATERVQGCRCSTNEFKLPV